MRLRFEGGDTGERQAANPSGAKCASPFSLRPEQEPAAYRIWRHLQAGKGRGLSEMAREEARCIFIYQFHDRVPSPDFGRRWLSVAMPDEGSMTFVQSRSETSQSLPSPDLF